MVTMMMKVLLARQTLINTFIIMVTILRSGDQDIILNITTFDIQKAF
jgi:hypothetical protein